MSPWLAKGKDVGAGQEVALLSPFGEKGFGGSFRTVPAALPLRAEAALPLAWRATDAIDMQTPQGIFCEFTQNPQGNEARSSFRTSQLAKNFARSNVYVRIECL